MFTICTYVSLSDPHIICFSQLSLCMYVWYQYFTGHLESTVLGENWENLILGCPKQKVVDLSRVVDLTVVDLSRVDCTAISQQKVM